MTQSLPPDSPYDTAAAAASAPAALALPAPAKGWRFSPHAIIFFSSACIMIVELVAGRLIARDLGSSLYTWTSIIGVVLAGMSVGNYVGGRMADRWKARRFLGWLFLAASATCLGMLALSYFLSESTWVSDTLDKWEMNLPKRIVLYTVTMFLPPALLLGMISPAAAKLALERSHTVGGTIGSVYAWGAIGSILGTFLAGFWLIAALGARGVVLAVALGLAVVGLVLGPKRILHAVWVVLLGGLLWLSQTSWDPAFQLACRFGAQEGEEASAWSDPAWDFGKDTRYKKPLFAKDSNYQFVRVTSFQDDETGRLLYQLELDSLIHGYVDLEDPAHLEYDYEELYASLSKAFAEGREKVAALFIGGGSYTFPRWVQNEWPGSQCDVAEIDPMVLEANYQALGLPRDTTIRTFLNDARVVVNQLPPKRQYDLIFGDAFNDLTVPWHLTTVEFHRKLQRLLRPGGVLLTNIIDDYETAGLFLGAYVETVRRVFRHVYVFCTAPAGLESGRETFVVAATDSPDAALLERLASYSPGHDEGFPGSLLTPEQLAALKAKCGGRVLTDDNAPVENLLVPVFRDKEP